MLETFLKLRWAAFGLLVVVAGAVSPGLMTAMVPDNALTVWFLETDPKLKEYYAFQDDFGNDEVILVEIQKPNGIFTKEALEQIKTFSERAKKIEGVDRVSSLVTLDDSFLIDGALTFERAVPDPIPDDPAVLKAIEERLVDNMLFSGRLVSPDGKRAMVWVQMGEVSEVDVRRDAIVAQVYEAADEVLGDVPHPMGGIGIIYSGLNVQTQADAAMFAPVSYLLLFMALWWVFRSMRLVVAALGVVALASTICLGIYGLLGNQINTVTVVLPQLIIVIGLADAVHFPAAFARELAESGGRSRFEIVKSSIGRVFVPCLFTTVTTMVGFLALATSPMDVIRNLGIYGALGIGVALIASVILMAVVFFQMPDTMHESKQTWISDILDRIRSSLMTNLNAMGALALLVSVLSLYGATLVVSDTDSIGYLPSDNKVVQDHETLESGWGYYTPFEFVITPADGYMSTSPEILNAIEAFIKKAEGLEAVRSGFSLTRIYRRMSQVLGATPEMLAEPMSDGMAAQLGMVLDFQRYEWDTKEPEYHDNILAPFRNQEASLGRITLIVPQMTAGGFAKLYGELEPMAKEAFGEYASFQPAGYMPLYITIIDYVLESQIKSFYVALGLIFLLMLVWLRSLRLAFISLIPNVFPVVVMMGVMGYLKINLDLGTATVAAIVLGVAIDDTVHFLHYWREAENKKLSWEDCLKYTFERAGEPAAVTTVLLMVGFPVLMLAGVKSVVYFGLLTTIAAFAAIFADVVILPIILKFLRPSWDRKEG